MTELEGLDPILVTDCFDVYVGCVSLSGHKLVVMQGLERLVIVSAGCFFHAVCRIWTQTSTAATPDVSLPGPISATLRSITP